ncbi:beta-ketoacyl synthase N-terminal-like domain-containing protein [Galbibacter sp. EGI 63066]|uniref:beta-ketoacyl synthase N-terminal-like domain-containing protein n=1 Tax=Galbibacter sp. EGI 63066 TaxID=2993559 RepID=UPI002249455E|nr:beta-ketoacyl synthase N-terminal-like domain-containing protein [Galbibacter sp. EGI 63066]MCX2678344.1 beta-ketoacyl synthase N-terminal-like domain-containing protein [Galbibacter sp. EGI 63066]
MKNVYINSAASISPQNTLDNSAFLSEIVSYNDNVLPALSPNYKEFIPPAAARRMAKGIKMGIVASKKAIQEANVDSVEAIITGTGMGCVRDSERFISAIIDNNEEYLTPTPFIQSTHNTVGGQIALGLKCKGYNFTYVHGSTSFEAALLDATMALSNNEMETVLIGGVDEIGEHTTELHKCIGHIKPEKVTTEELIDSKTSGTVFSEGANFFVLSNKDQASTYAKVIDIQTYNTCKDKISELAKVFMKDNNIKPDAIDVVVLGYNGDVDHDFYYDELKEDLFNDTQQVYYKHLSGEFNTASSFGFWLAARILKQQQIPDAVKLNVKETTPIKNVLLYNQYRGKDHSFILLSQC